MHSPAVALRREGALATVRAHPVQGMIALRADLSQKQVATAVKAATGTAIPAPLRWEGTGEKGAGWMSPDELLLLLPHAEVADRVARLSKALPRALAADVSDMRQGFALSGDHARDVLAKLTPVDMAEGAFPDGTFRRTRLAQVPAAIRLEGDTFHVIAFRSVAHYVRDLLVTAASAAPVHYHAR
ncbi:MAG: sarcosine oxidase subunit gamma [Hasllibacter sp.]